GTALVLLGRLGLLWRWLLLLLRFGRASVTLRRWRRQWLCVRVRLAAHRGERERAAGQDVNDAFLDELEELRAKPAVFVLAHAEVIGECGQLDSWCDQ